MKKVFILFTICCALLFTSCADFFNNSKNIDNSSTTSSESESSNEEEKTDSDGKNNDESPSKDKEDLVKEPEKENKNKYEITYTNVELIKSYSSGSSYYYLIAEIENTGTGNLYLDTGSMELEDAYGNLLGIDDYVYSFPNLIKPGEKGYMQSQINLDEKVEGKLKAIPRFNVKETKAKPVRLKTKNINIKDEKYSSLRALGRIENDTDDDVSGIKVACILYDINDKPIGIVDTYISSVEANQIKAFEAFSLDMPDTIKADDVNTYLCYAYKSYVTP